MGKDMTIRRIDDVAGLPTIEVDRLSPQVLLFLVYEVGKIFELPKSEKIKRLRVHRARDMGERDRSLEDDKLSKIEAGRIADERVPLVENWTDVTDLVGLSSYERCRIYRRRRGRERIPIASKPEKVIDNAVNVLGYMCVTTPKEARPKDWDVLEAFDGVLHPAEGPGGGLAMKCWEDETNFLVKTVITLKDDEDRCQKLLPLKGWLAGKEALAEVERRFALGPDTIRDVIDLLEENHCAANPFPDDGDEAVGPSAAALAPAAPAAAATAPAAPAPAATLADAEVLSVEDADAGPFATVADAVKAMGRLRADSSDAGARRSAIARRVLGADSPTGNPPQWHALVKAFMRASDLRNGLKVACKALETYPDNIELVADAINCSKVGEWELGLSCIEEAWRLGVDTWNPDTAIAIGVFYKYYVDSGNVKPQERSWTIDKGIFAHEKYRQETNDRNDRALHAEAELLMKKRAFASERKLLEGVIFPSDEEEVDEGEVFPQCCYRYFEDFLKDGGDSELMVKVCDKGIDGSKITGGRTAEEGYFHYHKACALDRLARKALEDLNEDDAEARKRAKKAVRLALNEYKKAYADDFNKPDWPRIHSYFDDLRSDALEEGMDVGDIRLDVRADEEQAAREAVRRKAIFYLDAEI